MDAISKNLAAYLIIGFFAQNCIQCSDLIGNFPASEEIIRILKLLPNASETMKENERFQANYRSRFSDWMGALPGNVSSAPLQGMVIPGSHDSMTYDLDPTSELRPGEDKPLEDVIHYVCKYMPLACKWIDKIIIRWAQCQKLNIIQQLDSGIRYFDLRIAAREKYNNSLYFTHVLFTKQTVKETMLQIHRWSVNHPREVLLLDLQHFYGLTESLHTKFIEEIFSIFGKERLVKRRNWRDLTLANLWNAKESVLICYRGNYNIPSAFKKFVWDGSAITSLWLQTSDSKKAIQYLNGNYSLGHDLSDLFYVTQGVLTPSAAYILWHLDKSLESTLSDEMTRAISTWVKDKHSGQDGLNVVIANSISKYSFVDNLLALNGR